LSRNLSAKARFGNEKFADALCGFVKSLNCLAKNLGSWEGSKDCTSAHALVEVDNLAPIHSRINAANRPAFCAAEIRADFAPNPVRYGSPELCFIPP
jgi:hypothetical protein